MGDGIRASALCPGLEARFPARRREERGCGPVTGCPLSHFQFSSVAQSCLTLCDPKNRSTPGLPVHHQLQESTQNHVHRVSDAIQHSILCHLLLLLPSTFPSIKVFSNESVLHIRWPKYWSFSFHISPSNEYLGLISPRMDWLDILAVQGTLKSLLQHHSSKACIGEGNGNPLQYSCLENPMDRGVW